MLSQHLLAVGILVLAVFAGSLVGTGVVLEYLRRRAILDHPNERSSHAVPTPRGGGIALVGCLIPAWAAIGMLAGRPGMEVAGVIGAALFLAGLSWLDDLGGLSAVVRLAAHAGAAALVLAGTGGEATYFQGLLPPILDTALAFLGLVWFINLFNFMDGIDGIAGVETVTIGAGIAAAALVGGLDGRFALFGLTAAVAALGFLRWNWYPARIFLGDVGSVPLGFLLGWLLLETARAGAWAAALIVPLYFLADATITLARRALRGEKIWQAHREHFYQQAVRRGVGHARISALVGLVGGVLAALGCLAAAGWPVAALGAACMVVASLLMFFAAGGKGVSENVSPPAVHDDRPSG